MACYDLVSRTSGSDGEYGLGRSIGQGARKLYCCRTGGITSGLCSADLALSWFFGRALVRDSGSVDSGVCSMDLRLELSCCGLDTSRFLGFDVSGQMIVEFSCIPFLKLWHYSLKALQTKGLLPTPITFQRKGREVEGVYRYWTESSSIRVFLEARGNFRPSGDQPLSRLVLKKTCVRPSLSR